jgi:hypothetical protein
MSKVGLFLQRWSRLKTQPLAEPASVKPVPIKSEAPSPATDEKPALPPVDDLTLESDFSAFMQPDVNADTRRAAMKKLFMNDHYRTMDGLDIYVDDYSKPELLPAAMLAQLAHATDMLAKPDPTSNGQGEPGVASSEHTHESATASQPEAAPDIAEPALPQDDAPASQKHA